jgi:uncharacterized protein (TIGR02118 family)
MVVISVMYPSGSDSTFDLDYYLKTHIPLVEARWREFGLSKVQVLKGAAAGNGGPPLYQAIALLTFGSLQDFQTAGKAHGKEIFADIPKFTNAQPVVQISDVLA